ncbi:MAG: response regulator transcription factor [Eubacteriales bacterium]|uniref:response regulator transcription factor n=1 Tax=Fenollaria sp. TaxID=1965292 RepID=UPI002A759B91|nr:response regulator transcription factor [Fenollaria sp.]MDD7339851.1 response regulator transcription factor [Eubacteriales bacterium]MDY3106079.1 response regulator transcription factor [Fenollaria sp.]
MSYRVLLVEDEAAIRKFVKINLEKEGYLVSDFPSAEEALEACKMQRFEIAVLDIMLEKMDGVTLLKILREVYPHMAIIMLTAKSEDIDKINAFESGADDYLSKPFNPKELILRIKSISRRLITDNKREENEIVLGKFRIDLNLKDFYLDGNLIELTPTEFGIIKYLIENANTLVKRKDIVKTVWGYDYLMDTKLVDVNISRLRKKIEKDPSNPEHLKTIWGEGFTFEYKE